MKSLPSAVFSSVRFPFLRGRCGTLSLALLLAVVVALPAAADSRYAIGDAVDFSATTADDEAFSLEDLRGRLVVVEFWATWCGPCIKMIPHLKQMHQEYRNQGVTMISVSTDRNASAARRMIRQKGMKWTMVLNAEQRESLSAKFFSGSFGIPHAFLISPDGNLLWNGHPAHLEDQIIDALENHPPHDDKADEDAADYAEVLESGNGSVIAREARKLLQDNAPNFELLLTLAAAIPADQLKDSKVRYYGRSAERVIRRFDDDQAAALAEQRAAAPEAAAALDLWLGVEPESEDAARADDDTQAAGE